MRRLTQEQLGILACYGDMSRKQVIEEIDKGITLADAEIRAFMETLQEELKHSSDEEFVYWKKQGESLRLEFEDM